MDSRDIKEEPIKVVGGKYLECIYSLQKKLLDHYIKIEGIQSYPVDVNTKRSQVLLKDFTGRVIEELAEGYEALILVDELTTKNKLWFGQELNTDDFVQTLNHLQNAGEEMADAMHFMTELLIYANIQPEDIESYLNKWIDKNMSIMAYNLSIRKLNTIAKAMSVGSLLIQTEYTFDYKNSNLVDLVGLYNLVKDEEGIPNIDVRFLNCGRLYNSEKYRSFKPMMWDVTYHLNIARNFLKNKPWKQSQMMTNEQQYQESLVKAFISMMGLFYMMGIDDENLFFLYFKKNMVNQFRIKSNY